MCVCAWHSNSQAYTEHHHSLCLLSLPCPKGTEVAPDGRRGLFVFTDQVCAVESASPRQQLDRHAPHAKTLLTNARACICQIGRSMGVWSRSLMQEGIANQHSSPAWGWRVVGAFGICPALFLLVLTM